MATCLPAYRIRNIPVQHTMFYMRVLVRLGSYRVPNKSRRSTVPGNVCYPRTSKLRVQERNQQHNPCPRGMKTQHVHQSLQVRQGKRKTMWSHVEILEDRMPAHPEMDDYMKCILRQMHICHRQYRSFYICTLLDRYSFVRTSVDWRHVERLSDAKTNLDNDRANTCN